jgi:hypothetical protein
VFKFTNRTNGFAASNAQKFNSTLLVYSDTSKGQLTLCSFDLVTESRYSQLGEAFDN